MASFLRSIAEVFTGLIIVASIFKTITILMAGQEEGISVKESLQKVKRVVKAAIVCLCIVSIIQVLKSYF